MESIFTVNNIFTCVLRKKWDDALKTFGIKIKVSKTEYTQCDFNGTEAKQESSLEGYTITRFTN